MDTQCYQKECWCSTPNGEKVFGTRQDFNYYADAENFKCSKDDDGNLKSNIYEGVLRLVNMVPKSPKGIVSVFHKGEWGLICDKNFDEKTGQVMCSQLGFDTYAKHTSLKNIPEWATLYKYLGKYHILKKYSSFFTG